MTFRSFSKEEQLAGHTRRADRLEAIDDAVRAAVWAEHKKCIVCEKYKRPAKDEVTRRAAGDEWAHFAGRNLLTNEQRADPCESTRLCKTHHDWHHRRFRAKHRLDMRYERETNTQHFSVDGVEVFTYQPKRQREAM